MRYAVGVGIPGAEMKTIGLIQARMGSVRLPGKVMKPLAGRPLVWHIADRLRRVDSITDLVLATTMSEENDPLVRWARDEGLIVVRHPLENDIAGRLAMAVRETGAEVIVKVNADCPLMDPDMIGRCLQILEADPLADGVTNKFPAKYPLGLSVEILTGRVISWCDTNLKSNEDRELTVKWIFEHPDRFRILNLEAVTDDSQYDLTVDTPSDYALVSEIFDALYEKGGCFGWSDVRQYIAERRSLPACAFLEIANAS